MRIEKIEVSKIKPYEKNARINEKAVDAVIKSIQESGYIAPVVVDENYVILAGHTRMKALKKLGFTTVECVVKSGLSEKQKKAYRIADNKTGEIADWDFGMLREELEELQLSDYDLDSLGFDTNEINDILFKGIQTTEEYLQRQVESYSGAGVGYGEPMGRARMSYENEDGEIDYKNREEHFKKPEQFKSFDEDIETEHRCPKCGYEW